MEALCFAPPKKFKRMFSAGKVMASIFWHIHGFIMVGYFEEGRTIIMHIIQKN